MKNPILIILPVCFWLCATACGQSSSVGQQPCAGLRNTTVLLLRHAEKPDSGTTLSPEGEKRAAAYTSYFKNLTDGSQHLTPAALFATADSKESSRPRLTLEPLSHSLGLKINTHYKNKKMPELARELRDHPHGNVILIAWHHGEIPELLQALGADPAKFLPDGKWPGHIFGWLIELRFDGDGRLLPAQSHRLDEHLLPGD